MILPPLKEIDFITIGILFGLFLMIGGISSQGVIDAAATAPPIGASANVTGIGILRKNGYTVKNKDFFRIGIPFTLAAIIPAYIYIWFVYGV